jgi:thiosulfate dehydrogenase [quinone] large subunit
MPPGLALLPLRLFLGATFVYAGVYKLSDAGFLHAGSETYIGDQLEGFAQGTPGGPLLEALALPHPVLAGVGVALAEVAIGLLALVGRFTRIVAIGGLGLSLVLFLTASWHTTPYFLGSDIVFAFAWLPFALAGAAGQPALDNGRPRAIRLRRRGRLVVPAGGAPLTRRAAILQALGFTAAATGLVAGVSIAARGSLAAPARAARRAATGTAIADSSALAPGDALAFTNPADGSPALVIRGTDGALSAFGATCTHAGCEVGWRNGEIRCPCHHARFDPATGRPTRGPARDPLPVVEVVERGGKIVVE